MIYTVLTPTPINGLTHGLYCTVLSSTLFYSILFYDGAISGDASSISPSFSMTTLLQCLSST